MASWEEKFENLLSEYSLLSAEHNQLKLSSDRLKKYCRFLEEENLSLRDQISHFKSSGHEKQSEIQISHSLTDLKHIKPKQTKPARFISPDTSQEVPAKVFTPMKTPQPTPDTGAESESSSSLFEAFFVIGLKEVSLETRPGESILFEYPANNSISKAMKNVFPNIALSRKEVKELKLTGSASEVNNLIFGQIPSKRNENCFIFTLRTEEVDKDIELDLPNSNHEVVYFTCLVIDDIHQKEDIEFIVSKSYCIASYVPAFELHYETLCSILFLKRLHRMNLMSESDVGEITPSLSNLHITDEGVELLEELGKVNYFEERSEIVLKTKSMDCLKYQVPQNVRYLDVAWLCIPLFSSLPVEDLCWLVSALVQEKSIIFISNNLGLLTSAVLGLRSLIRPLNWLSLTVPLIPENLKEIIEAPVPLLAGTTYMDANTRYKFSNIVWVLLDENDPEHRIQVSRNCDFEVAEIGESLVSQVRKHYKFSVNTIFEKNSELQNSALVIADIFWNYWRKLIGFFSVSSCKRRGHVEKVMNKFPEKDKKFVKVLIQTQLFANSIDSNR
jgi:hypothetical protein